MALKNAYDEGFPQERIDAILHRIELGTKHQSSNFGLGLVMAVNSPWNHDVDPITCLKVNQHVDTFKENLRNDPKYLKNKVKQYFLNNTHKLVVQMSPSDDYEDKLTEAEQKLLQKKIEKLSADDKQQIYQTGLDLLKSQDNKEDLSVLPTLKVADISPLHVTPVLEHVKLKNVPTQYSIQPTNGIVYFNSVLSLNRDTFPRNLIPYLPLFTQVMAKLGAGSLDRKAQDQAAQMCTSGLHGSVHIADSPLAFDQFEQGIYLGSHCLEKNVDSMFRLWTDVFNGIRFDDDHEHLAQLIRICSAEMAAGVPSNGHRYAMNRAASAFGGPHEMRELTSGMTSLAYFRLLASSTGDKMNEIVKHLKEVCKVFWSKTLLNLFCRLVILCWTVNQCVVASMLKICLFKVT